MASFDDLWGGQLTSFQFDTVNHVCDLLITTQIDSQENLYILECRDVTDFRFHNAIPEPWTYAELTEIHVNFDKKSNHYVVDMILWSEDSDLSVRCSSIDIRHLPPML